MEDFIPKNDARFTMELEFVQCLASPRYCHWLAQNKYFDDQRFVAYLKYLLYWKDPAYAKYIQFPHALFFLELLQSAKAREEFRKPQYTEFVFQQQYYHWQHGKYVGDDDGDGSEESAGAMANG